MMSVMLLLSVFAVLLILAVSVVGAIVVDKTYVIDRDVTPEAGEFEANGVTTSEVQILMTGSVTNNFSFTGSLHANTGGEDRMIMGCIAMNSSLDVFDDGTDVLTIYVTTGGRAYLKTSAGADTFDITLNYQYT